ncbi:MAG TPA: peptide deformylase [Actinomycetes bacterium]|nr:peptide deformylase [Actinomycetes bacterium]
MVSESGSVLPVVRAPAPVLSTTAVEVDPTAAEVVQLAHDLVATMYASPGCVGLAAPQVGVSWRLFCVDTSGHPRTPGRLGCFVLVNPRIVEASEAELAREGCLSVPDLTGDVRRATHVVVAGLTPGTGEERSLEADGFEARAVQHELDHVDGKLFLDRVVGVHAVHARRVYR